MGLWIILPSWQSQHFMYNINKAMRMVIQKFVRENNIIETKSNSWTDKSSVRQKVQCVVLQCLNH